MHTIVYYYIDILKIIKIKNMISTKYLHSAAISLLFRNGFNLVKGTYEENISKQLRKMIYTGVLCMILLSCHTPTMMFLHILRVCLSRCLSILNIGGTHISIAIIQSEIMCQCTYILLCLKLNRRVNFDIHMIGLSKIKSDNEDGTKIALISLLIYNILCELCNVIIKPINKIVLSLFNIHPMPFLSHIHNMLYNVRTHYYYYKVFI